MQRLLDTRILKSNALKGLFFGIAVIAVMAMWTDSRQISEVITDFNWTYAPIIILLVLAGYAGRFLKWQLYVRTLAFDISYSDSARIFFSGLSMAITPGKLGEVLKSYLLWKTKRIDFYYSASTVIAERLTDMIALLFLSLFGVYMLPGGWFTLGAAAMTLALIISIFLYRPLAQLILDVWSKIPVLSKFACKLEQFYTSAVVLLRGSLLVKSIILSIVSWFMECLAFYFILQGYRLEVSLQESTMILSIALIAGAISMLPGGLGATEGIMAGLLISLGVDRIIAAAITLLTRFFTLWFAVAVGTAVLIISWRRFGLRRDE